jgi:hypothetical protein
MMMFEFETVGYCRMLQKFCECGGGGGCENDMYAMDK